MDTTDNKVVIKTIRAAYPIFKPYEDLLLVCKFQADDLEVSIFTDSEAAITIGYKILGELYWNDFLETTHVIFNKRRMRLDDERLEKYFYHFTLTPDILTSFPTPGLIERIIHDYQINEINELMRVVETKFSNFFDFDEFDAWQFGFQTERRGLVLKHINGVTVFNRLINQNITISDSDNICFVNCVFMGRIDISDSTEIEFIGCIMKEEVQLIGRVSNPYFGESNINVLALRNAKIDKFRMNECNIFALIVLYSVVEKCSWNSLKISFFTTEISSLPKDQILLSYIDLKNIRPKAYENCTPNPKFFINFYQRIPCKTGRPGMNAACASTFDFLEQNAILGTDKNAIAELKYKKIFYSVSGLKKLYVFLTGGYYKPLRFMFYTLILNIFMMIFFTLPFHEFQSTDGVFKMLSLKDSVLYCLDLIIGTNMFQFSALGISRILSLLYKSLNLIFFTGFFTALVKKYFE